MSGMREYIWFEKHRPKTLNDLSLNKNHKASFAKFIADGEIPHILLNGPPGSGKTTIAYILLDSIPSVRLSLNASGRDRGIKTITGDVVQFAKSKAPAGKTKVVFLDESDQMTHDAQSALKNTMETYSANCRFILTCNHVDKIIPPIKSRCIRFDFDQFPKRRVTALCEKILEKEGVPLPTKEEMTALVDRYFPDIRSVVQGLQAACLGGEYNPKALSQVMVDPYEVCQQIFDGNIMTIRKMVAGVTDFMFMYRFIIDTFIPDIEDDVSKGLLVDAVVNAVRVENIVPDREINFIGCVNDICAALEIKPNFDK